MLKLEIVKTENYRDSKDKPIICNKLGLFSYKGNRIHTLFMTNTLLAISYINRIPKYFL